MAKLGVPPMFGRDMVVNQTEHLLPVPGLNRQASPPLPRQPVVVKAEPLTRGPRADWRNEDNGCKPGGLFNWRQRDVSPASSSGADSTGSYCQRLKEEAVAQQQLLDDTLAQAAHRGLLLEELENTTKVQVQEFREALSWRS